jgi:hypothetical protein
MASPFVLVRVFVWIYSLYASAQNEIKRLHQNKAKVTMALKSRKKLTLFLKM